MEVLMSFYTRKPIGQRGLDFESSFVTALNGKKLIDLSPHLKALVHTIFPTLEDASMLLAQKADPRGKSDVSLFSEVGRAEISLKSVNGDIVHSSPNDKFVDYLRRWRISEASIDTLLLYLYRDGTTDGTGGKKWSYEETLFRLSNRIKDFNREVNENRDFLQDCLDLCLFRGNHAELEAATCLYHGDLDSGFLVSRYQIAVWARKIVAMDFIRNPHVGPLHIRPFLQKEPENEFKKEKLRWLRMKWVGMDANLLYLSKHLPFRKKKRII